MTKLKKLFGIFYYFRKGIFYIFLKLEVPLLPTTPHPASAGPGRLHPMQKVFLAFLAIFCAFAFMFTYYITPNKLYGKLSSITTAFSPALLIS